MLPLIDAGKFSRVQYQFGGLATARRLRPWSRLPSSPGNHAIEHGLILTQRRQARGETQSWPDKSALTSWPSSPDSSPRLSGVLSPNLIASCEDSRAWVLLPLPTTQEWAEDRGEGRSKINAPPLPAPLHHPMVERELIRLWLGLSASSAPLRLSWIRFFNYLDRPMAPLSSPRETARPLSASKRNQCSRLPRPVAGSRRYAKTDEAKRHNGRRPDWTRSTPPGPA